MEGKARHREEAQEGSLFDPEVPMAEDWNVQLLGGLPLEDGEPIPPSEARPAETPRAASLGRR